MIAFWRCNCGFETASAREAFSHRDGTDSHHVHPAVAKLSGIEKHTLKQEIRQLVGAQ